MYPIKISRRPLERPDLKNDDTRTSNEPRDWRDRVSCVAVGVVLVVACTQNDKQIIMTRKHGRGIGSDLQRGAGHVGAALVARRRNRAHGAFQRLRHDAGGLRHRRQDASNGHDGGFIFDNAAVGDLLKQKSNIIRVVSRRAPVSGRSHSDALRDALEDLELLRALGHLQAPDDLRADAETPVGLEDFGEGGLC